MELRPPKLASVIQMLGARVSLFRRGGEEDGHEAQAFVSHKGIMGSQNLRVPDS